MNRVETLANCPFCGGIDIRRYHNLRDGFEEVFCDDCGATVSEEKYEAATAAWNRRTPIAAGSGEADDSDRLTAALVALVRHNIPVDVQELLVQGNPMRGIAPGALEAALPPKVSARRVTKADRFYGDPVVRFRAMASATYSTDHIDGAHFRMWCGIAANEIETLRAALSTAGAAEPVDAFEICAKVAEGHADLVEEMRGVYPGDPHGALGRDANKMRKLAKAIRALRPGDGTEYVRRTPIAAGSGEAKQVKLIATKFFRWWWNQPGANTDQGYDEWAETEGAPLLAALSPCRIGEETEEAKVWRLPEVEAVLHEMLAVATSGEDDEEPEWMADQRATVDIWQAGLRASLSRKTAGEAVEPVAWQWRHRTRGAGEWREWSGWHEGRRETIRTATYESEERALVVASPPLPDTEEKGTPVAWIDMRSEPAEDWTKRVVATNPEFVAANGAENFLPLGIIVASKP